MATNTRSPFLVDLPGDNVVMIQLKESSFDESLRTVLGLTLAKDGVVPEGKTLVGRGRMAAMLNGCFALNVVYKKTGNKTQQAKVICSPTKADTVFKDGVKASYNGKNIVEIRVPRRRVYTY